VTEIANTPRPLPLLDDPTTDSGGSGGCGCGGCGCGASEADTATSTTPNPAEEDDSMTTQTYPVSGMTCGHCATAVTSELMSLAGVTDVHVDLVADGTSAVTVISQDPLDETQVAAALDEAGDYHLVQQ
jgi:copper chaperone